MTPKENEVDNFNQLRPYFDNLEDNDFIFVQIIQRKKEIPELGCNNRLIKSYTVKSFNDLVKYKSEIISICKVLNARAYVHLSPRNFRTIQSDMLASIAEYFKSNTYQHIPKLFNTACGKSKGKIKLWIADLDSNDNSQFIAVMNEISLVEKRQLIYDIFKTKNGWHFILNPFNISAYDFPQDVEIHKNNPTILYTTL